jgi:hypothetical protein
VGDLINFSGSATDSEDGTLPASALSWTLIIHHCPSNCHIHIVQTWTGVSSGSFNAPDHEYPSYLELQLTAIDSGGQSGTTSLELDPQSVTLTFGSNPSGLQLVVNSVPGTTPFTRTVITGSANTISAGSPQTLNATNYVFSSWSDGGAASHNITANTSSTYTATYTVQTTGGDTTPPTSSITCNSTTCSTGWYASAVSVALAATDAGGSGVDAIRYTLDGSDPTTSSTGYTGPIAVSATTTVKYRAWDKAGNVESTKSQLISIDTSSPAVAITSPANGATVTGTIKLTATTSDTGSGVSTVRFYADGVLIATKSGAPFTISWNTKKAARGQHTLYAIARDFAGNEQTSASITVTVR